MHCVKGATGDQLIQLLECVQVLAPANSPLTSPTIWRNEGFFRLFLSHRFEDRKRVQEVADHLLAYGVDGFVAHADIETSDEWLDVIESALATCDALACFLTPEFRGGDWCDQEIGFVHGRGCLIVPVDLGMKPYGLVGRFQATAPLGQAKSEAIADSIHDTLCGKALTRDTARSAMFVRFRESDSFKTTQLVRKRILRHVKKFSTRELEILQEAVENNHEVSGTRLPSAAAWVQELVDTNEATN